MSKWIRFAGWVQGIRKKNYLAVSLCLMATMPAAAQHIPDRSFHRVPFASETPLVDGLGEDAVWDKAEWRPITYRWLGPEYTAQDFAGRFKVAWDSNRLYLLVEITDDTLYDAHRHPLTQYWDDDCLEVFVDEDHSGGEHQYNHNAFAYHFSLDNQAIDIGTDRAPRNYTQHVESQWRQNGETLLWEVSIALYADTYIDDKPDQLPVKLTPGKVIGLMVAYCDNDGSELRENFIGSEQVTTGATDRGWIDANIFGAIELVREELQNGY